MTARTRPTRTATEELQLQLQVQDDERTLRAERLAAYRAALAPSQEACPDRRTRLGFHVVGDDPTCYDCARTTEARFQAEGGAK